MSHANHQSTYFLYKLPYVCKALTSLASCSSPGKKAVASAENLSSGSVMFSRCLRSFISGGAMLLRLLFVSLYIQCIISLTCRIQTYLYNRHQHTNWYYEVLKKNKQTEEEKYWLITLLVLHVLMDWWEH